MLTAEIIQTPMMYNNADFVYKKKREKEGKKRQKTVDILSLV